MEGKKLRCIVKADSNVIRIISVPKAGRASGITKRKKKTSNTYSTGRWDVREQLAFIESTLEIYP